MGIDDHDTFTGLTPLQQACLDGNIEKVLELVDAGADVDIQANGEMAGKTAAMIAASEGSTDILKAMNRGPSLLNLKDADGGTAAMTAAVHKHGSVLDYVRPVFSPRQDRSAEARSRPARAQPSRAPERPGSIAIHDAPRARARTPARRSGRPDPPARARRDSPRSPRSPRSASARAKRKPLEGFPHSRSDRDDDGSIPAHVLEAGRPARPSAFSRTSASSFPSSSLALTSSPPSSPSLRPKTQLIEKKVDLNATDRDGWTALMYAVTVGAAEAVGKLVAAGVDVTIKNADGDTALDLAKANKKRHNLIQIINPSEPMPTVAE